MSDKAGNSQVISLPTGGGALHGIGEKFSPDRHTGTGNFTVPIALPPGRNGFQPQLSLVYSTGNGNGPWGLGWSLSIPGVSRKTSKGVPRYQDEKDVFILSSAEDLVRVSGSYPGRVQYRPRTEGLFALIEHVRDAADNYWEVRSKDGLISTYGTPGRLGVDDPAAIGKDDTRKFAWKLSQTRDPFNNLILYDYVPDQGMQDAHVWNQPLLNQIRYADYDEAGQTRFLVSVAFAYEDRHDPFSDYRAGFEIRLSQRCTTITIKTHAVQERVMRQYRFEYEDAPGNGISLLKRIDVIGFDDEGNAYHAEEGDASRYKRQLPPLELGYTPFEPAGRRFQVVTGADLPARSLANPDLDLVDLSGDGLPDILEMNGTVRYWRNLGGGRYDLPRPMRDAPPHALSDPGVQILDANGDGRLDLMVTDSTLAGYYPMTYNAAWDRRSFQKYKSPPSFNMEDPEVRLVDLDGDGVTDAIRSGTRLECVFNDPRLGWSRVVTVHRKPLEAFPDVSFSDPRVKLGDMTGDGMQDIILVYDGNTEYWPNLGFGNWGKRVHMQNSPRFREYGYIFGYDPRRILLGDVDGDGCADIVYVGDGKVTLWINQSGNRWSDPIEICGTPPVADIDAVRLVDLMGSGISGVLWSADASESGRPHMYFLDFTGGVKPYLLNEMDNHLGALTKVEYCPSTRFSLEDRQSPKSRWRTHLPFPVQVVARVEVIDRFSQSKLTTAYRYHHGYWDGAEREFRGFGMVEQLDTETFELYCAPGLHGLTAFADVVWRHFSPPTLTRNWFHQGPVEDDSGEWYELDLSSEYWPGDPPLLDHIECVNRFLRSLPVRLDRRDALRTLRGSILRTELYALDRFPDQDYVGPQDLPYTITEQAYDLRALPASGGVPIFFPHIITQRTTQWERGDDPMTLFSFTGDYDDFGQPRRQTMVGMPRRSAKRLDVTAAVVGAVPVDEDRVLATHTRTTYAAPDAGLYMHDRVLDMHTYELIAPPQVDEQNEQGNDISADVLKVLEAQYRAASSVRAQFDGLPGVKLIGHVLNHYDGPAFEGRSDGKVGPYGALTRSEALVFGEDELNAAYGKRRPLYLGGRAPLPDGAPAGFENGLGYRLRNATPYENGYYADTQRRCYDFQETDPPLAGWTDWPGRGLVTGMQDPRRNTSIILPDRYWLLPEQVKDPAGMEVKATYNYRLLQPASVTDVNGNTTCVHFSPIGLVQKQWLASQDGAQGGDEDHPEVEFVYDFLAYDRTRDDDPKPIYAHARQRVWHASDGRGDEWIEAREYSDGFGRLLQKRAQGDTLVFGASGDDVGLPEQAGVAPGTAVGEQVADCVIVSGWQVYDNKGRVVEKYEPFFSTGWDYEPDEGHGVHAELTYDPRGQLICTLNPDGSEQRLVFGIPHDLNTPQDFAPTPWETYTYDPNDLAPLTADAAGDSLVTRAPATHHFTPANSLFNAQGKVIAQIVRNGPTSADRQLTRSRYDVRGNLIEIVDALGRTAFRHGYDLLNRALHVDSIDAGLRTSILDGVGNLVEYRDSKGAVALRRYDELNRLTEFWAVNNADATQAVTLREKIVYGDNSGLADALDRNLLGKPYLYYDEAGLLAFERYDFKGNLVEKSRTVISDAAIADGWIAHWEDETVAEDDLDTAQTYQTSTGFDALNRPVSVLYPAEAQLRPGEISPHRAELILAYNRAGALQSIRLDSDAYVQQIAYNARGQRVLIVYGNQVMTRYCYDPETFRLKRLRTERFDSVPGSYSWQGGAAPLQDYTYAYDLMGNILSIDERVPGCGIAQPPYSGGRIDRDRLLREFQYDPLYRLIYADGRACKSQTSRPFEDLLMCGSSPANFNQTNAPDLTEPYWEKYQYDPAGNMLDMSYHSGTGAQQNAWTRTFGMGGKLPADWDQAPNNRLTQLLVGQNPRNTHTYQFDDNGNLRKQDTSQEHIWDHVDRMVAYQNGTSVEARYLYGADGLRVKKWVRTNGTGEGESTVYIDGIFEHQRWRKNGQSDALNHLHVMDDQSGVAILRVGTKHPDDGGERVQYHLGDHLGSSGLVVGGADVATSTFINREEFSPYGETSFGSFGRKRYRYTGKERDQESGLDYRGARYLSPHLARWASCDPFGSAVELNLYAYCRSSPLTLGDPDGRSSEPAAGVAQLQVAATDFADEWEMPDNWVGPIRPAPAAPSPQTPDNLSAPPLAPPLPPMDIYESWRTGAPHETPLFEGTVPADIPGGVFVEQYTGPETQKKEQEKSLSLVPQTLRPLAEAFAPSPKGYYTTLRALPPEAFENLNNDAPDRARVILPPTYDQPGPFPPSKDWATQKGTVDAASPEIGPMFELPGPDADASKYVDTSSDVPIWMPGFAFVAGGLVTLGTFGILATVVVGWPLVALFAIAAGAGAAIAGLLFLSMSSGDEKSKKE